MGIKIFIDATTRGVGATSVFGNLSANGQKLITVLANGLPGSLASVGVRGQPLGVAAGTFTGRLSTSRSVTGVTGVSTSSGVGTLTTGSNATRWGFNVAGLEWMSLAYSRAANSTSPNRDYGVGRDALIQYLATNGFTVTRLPFLWEYIQPVLNSQGAQSNVLNAYGLTASGQLCPQAVRQITDVLNSHQTAGIKCMLDMHNYCRYIDYIWNNDGSVPGFTIPGFPSMPYSSSGSTQTRIMSQGSASLTQADYANVWQRIANQFKGHPGLGGYMIMNEPHDMDNNATWPQYAQVAINAIRAVDASTPIYVGGNNYSNTTTIGTSNPGFPLSGVNLIYEGHMYLDASSSGAYFNWDSEVAKGFSVGEGGSINTSTGFNRLKYMTDWLTSNVKKGAVTECGFPTSDTRWSQSFKSATDLAWQKGLEWYTWMIGDHWPIHGHPIGANPEYHQGQQFESLVAGVMKSSMGRNIFNLFDASQSYVNGAGNVTVTLFCRGNVTTPFVINLSKSGGMGALSTSAVTMPAGANPSVTYTYTAVTQDKAIINYGGPDPAGLGASGSTFTQPPGSVSIVTYGATSGGANCRTAFNNAIAAAAAQSIKTVWVPAGVWHFTGGVIPCRDVLIVGAGYTNTTIYADDYLNSSIWLEGNGPGVIQCTLTGAAAPARQDTLESSKVLLAGCKNFIVRDNRVVAAPGASIIADRDPILGTSLAHGYIAHNTVSDSLADSIHMTVGASDVLIEYNDISNSGDDGVAVVSYRDDPDLVTSFITARFNRIMNNVSGRGMSVVGGQDIHYYSNYIEGNAGDFAGIYISRESSFQTMAACRIKVELNTVKNCGNNLTTGHGNIMVFSEDDGTTPNDDIWVLRNDLINTIHTGTSGVTAFGPQNNIKLDQNRYTGVGTAYDVTAPTSPTVSTAYSTGAIGYTAPAAGTAIVMPPARSIYSYTAATTYPTSGLSAPTLNTPTKSATGGSLTAATYRYKVTAVNANGETTGSNEVSIACTGSTSYVNLTWSLVPGAIGYKIYRGTAAGAENIFFCIGNDVGAYRDFGTSTTSGTVPGSNTTSNLVDAGRAIIAKYSAAEWLSTNGAKDYIGLNGGKIAADGEFIRGIWDSGYASTKDNVFSMVQWITTGADYGPMSPPTKSISGARHRLDTIGATTSSWGTSISQAMSPVQNNLSKVEALIWDASNPALAFNLIPAYTNVATIWAATFAGPAQNTNNNGDGSLEFKYFGNINASQVQNLRARGTKAILAVGGASNGYNITTRQQSTNFVNTFATIASQLGGVDGISLEFFQGGVGSSVNEVVFIVQSLRSRYGQSFIVTSMPNPTSATDQSLLSSLFSSGALSWAMPQYFQSATWAGNTAGIVSNLNTWKGLLGGDASAVMAAFPCNSSQNAGPTVNECVSVYTSYVLSNPTFRGVIGWTAQINQASTTSSGGGNVFGLSCRKHDNKAAPFQGTGLEDPTNPTTVLFDIQDQHFVVACVELQNTSSDGAIFNTSNAQQGAFSELGMTNGGTPTASWSDYNGNSISLQSASGLSAGAHVLTSQSTGSAQLLRVDKTQVTSGNRTLSANSGVTSDQHQIGWRYYNFFERGTPGCYIYGVVAGKGNPSSSELTVMERYLGNTYAGLSL